jgi:hypothetical protein
LSRAKNPLYFEKSTFSFSQLNKKITSLESYLKRVGFEDKGQSFPKKLFLFLSVNHGHRRSQFMKNGGFDFKLKKGHKKNSLFFFILNLYNLEIIMQKINLKK